MPRREAFERIETIHEEFAHYMAFADLYDAIRPQGTLALDPHLVEPWAEDEALNKFRHDCMASHGEIGIRATKFSEGGYCTLFREGMRLQGRGGTDDLIAQACAAIYDDEFGHMLKGIIGLEGAGAGLKEAEWRCSATWWSPSCGTASTCGTRSSAILCPRTGSRPSSPATSRPSRSISRPPHG